MSGGSCNVKNVYTIGRGKGGVLFTGNIHLIYYPGQSHLRPQSNFFRFPLIAKICAGIEVGSVEDSVDTEYFSLRLGNSLCSYDII